MLLGIDSFPSGASAPVVGGSEGKICWLAISSGIGCAICVDSGAVGKSWPSGSASLASVDFRFLFVLLVAPGALGLGALLFRAGFLLFSFPGSWKDAIIDSGAGELLSLLTEEYGLAKVEL